MAGFLRVHAEEEVKGTTTAFIGWLTDADVGVVVACNAAPEHHPTVAGHAVLTILNGKDPEVAVPRLALEEKAERLTGSFETYRGVQSATVERSGTGLALEIEGRLGTREFALSPVSSRPTNLTYTTVSGDKRVTVEFLETADGIDLLFQRWRFHQT